MTIKEASPLESVNLLEVITRNDVDTRWFVPFMIYRLQPATPGKLAVDLKLNLINISNTDEEPHLLRLYWSEEIATLGVPLVQDRVITEWADCGIACVLIPLYTNYRIIQVTQVGDGFDYWVGNDTEEFALEVSGTLKGDIRQRHKIKVKQLHQNPGQWDGFVSVTSFHERHSILSFHKQKETKGEN